LYAVAALGVIRVFGVAVAPPEGSTNARSDGKDKIKSERKTLVSRLDVE
jgi:hypothetical protein